MKKVFVYAVCAALVLSGCGTYTGAGAYTGAQFGSILGSAIGGITDGYRGSHVGTIIGMAGGAVVGAMVGNAADEASRREVRDHYDEVQRRKSQNGSSRYDDSGYYSPDNSGDDRLYDFQSSDYTSDYSASSPRIMDPASSSIEDITSDYSVNRSLVIRNPRFVDDNHDGWLKSNETSKVIFEIYNASGETLYDIQPTVIEASKCRNIYISPNIHVERLEPGKAIRYTAMVKAGKLRDGSATFCLSVLQGNRVMSNVAEFTVTTRR
ncbi:MAG: hypothetical protein J5637_03720 [Prevotella sp.]|nr:hypothetical protein [Prevotella sp.]